MSSGVQGTSDFDRRLVIGRRWCGGVAVVVGLMLLSGCTMGPELYRPANATTDATGFVNDPTLAVSEAEVVQLGRWWERFGDPVTVELVETAVRNNPDLIVAAARVMEARATLASAYGRQLPQVDGAFSAERRETSFNLPGGRARLRTTSWDAMLNISWQADLWGKLARNEQAAWASLLATEADRVGAMHSLVAEVIRTRVQIATLEQRIAVAEGNIATLTQTFDIARRRWEEGIRATPADHLLAQSDLSIARAERIGLQRQLRLSYHALDILLGRRPGTGSALPGTLAELPDLSPVPVGMPASLLDRRPDLRASELRAMAEQARVGAAIADLFPSLTLSAQPGLSADDFKELFDTESFVYGIVGEVAHKIFSGGQLTSAVRASEARAEAMAAMYASDVLQAMREVEDALVEDVMYQRQLAELNESVTAATAAEKALRERYLGAVGQLTDVLDTERRRRIAEEARLLARQGVWNARISLFLALGGDWQLPADEPQDVYEQHRAPEMDVVDEQINRAPNLDRLVAP